VTVTVSNPVPFLVGFVLVAAHIVHRLVWGTWKYRHNAGPSRNFDSEFERAIEEFRRTDWRWPFIFAGPFVGGVLTYVAWWAVYLLARWLW